MAVSLPIVLLILDVYPLRRLGGAVGWWSEPARRVYVEKIPFVLLAAAASAVALMAQLSHDTMVSVVQLSGLGRLAVSMYGVSFYLWKTVAPVNLSPLYELPPAVNPWAPPFLLSYGLVLAITAIVLAFRRRVPGLPAAWVTYIVVLLPVLGIFQSGSQIAADRYTYLAGLGWAILAGAGLLSCWHATRFLIPGCAVCLLLCLAVLTWNQVQVWHDSKKLWSHAAAIAHRSPVGQYSLCLALVRQGKLTEAIEHFKTALQIKPEYPDAHTNVGAALADQGKLAEAIDYYREALQSKPDDALAHYNWGVALARQSKMEEAIGHYRQALQSKPNYAEAHNNVGAALADQGKLAEAIDHYRQALQNKPDFALGHYNWGLALAQQGKPAEASEHYQQALHIDPDDADAHTNWRHALTQQGKPAAAIDHYREALQIKPGYAIAHINWGVALAQQAKLAAATEHYRQALQLKPDSAEAHANWGLALADQGKLAEAIDHYRLAQQIKPDSAEFHVTWGTALADRRRLAEAIEHYRQALHIKPDHAAAQSSLLNVLRRLGTGKEDAAPSRKGEKTE